MIVDVHTHPPLYKDPLTGAPDQYNHVWRPDRAVKVTTCWDDYLEAQEPAEKSIVFSIATNPGRRAAEAARTGCAGAGALVPGQPQRRHRRLRRRPPRSA